MFSIYNRSLSLRSWISEIVLFDPMDLRLHEVVEVCILELKFIWSTCTWEFQVEEFRKVWKIWENLSSFGQDIWISLFIQVMLVEVRKICS